MNNTNKFLKTLQERRQMAFFFDMDGTLINSMPYHSRAWTAIMQSIGIDFDIKDCYLEEGRTGHELLKNFVKKYLKKDLTEAELQQLYREKSKLFDHIQKVQPIEHVCDVLQFIRNELQAQLWVVTGSGLEDLWERLNGYFPDVFGKDKIICAYDIKQGKPAPDPYLTAWERSGLPKENCCVVENAPLGVLSGKRAELFTVAVNTGILENHYFEEAGADVIFPSMEEFLAFLQQ